MQTITKTICIYDFLIYWIFAFNIWWMCKIPIVFFLFLFLWTHKLVILFSDIIERLFAASVSLLTLRGSFVITSLTFKLKIFLLWWLALLNCPSVIIPVVNFFLLIAINIPSFFFVIKSMADYIFLVSSIKGMSFFDIIRSSVVLSWFPILPWGCNNL